MPTPQRPAFGRLQSFGLSWPLLVAVTVCIGFLSGSTTQILGDPDTWLHLATGHWILQHHSVPVVDPFSYPMAGAPWIAHEWLAQCLMAVAYDWCCWTGLVLLAAGAFALTLACLLRFMLGVMPAIYALLFCALASSALAPHLLARPHVLAWPILALWAGSLIKASERKRPPPWHLAGLMVLWANLHGSFTLGLVLVMAGALEVATGSPAAERWKTLKPWCAFFCLSVLAAMITPAGWRGLWFTFHVVNLKHLDVIGEWMPTSFAAFNPLELWLLVLLGLAMCGYLRLPLVRLLLLMGLLHQALAHGRYLSIFGMLTPLLIAASFAAQYRIRSEDRRDVSALDDFFDVLAAPAQRVMVAAAVLLVLLTGLAVHGTGQHRPEASISPRAAVQAAMDAGAKGHVLNQYSFGGYLIDRGIPVFIDGRADLYGDRHMGAYLDGVESGQPEKIRKVLDDFQIGWTLLRPDSATVRYLDQHNEWRRVYADESAVVHIRQ